MRRLGRRAHTTSLVAVAPAPRPAPTRVLAPHVRPVWFLDVDGVLSPYQPEWRETFLYGDGRSSVGMVPFRQSVVDRVHWLHASGLVEVQWLTTWADEELGEWSRVGLGPFLTGDRDAEGPFSWWKANAVHDFLSSHPDRQMVWTDDDIEVNPHRARRIREAGGARLLAVCPHRDRGLTDEDLDGIEVWLTNLIR